MIAGSLGVGIGGGRRRPWGALSDAQGCKIETARSETLNWRITELDGTTCGRPWFTLEAKRREARSEGPAGQGLPPPRRVLAFPTLRFAAETQRPLLVPTPLEQQQRKEKKAPYGSKMPQGDVRYVIRNNRCMSCPKINMAVPILPGVHPSHCHRPCFQYSGLWTASCKWLGQTSQLVRAST
jgi:hypothetical protein